MIYWRMTRHSDRAFGKPNCCSYVGFLMLYCYGLVLIVSICATSVASSPSSLASPEPEQTKESSLDSIVVTDDEMKPLEFINAAKRMIQTSLWMEDVSPSLLSDQELDYDSSMLADDLTRLLGLHFDRNEIESMIQDGKKEWNTAKRRTISENATTNPKSLPSATKPSLSTDGECLASKPLVDSGENADENVDGSSDYRMVGDRHASGLLETIRDTDCLEREFDVEHEDSFDVEDAIDVLKRCRILVLRNAFSKETTDRVFPHYIQYISDVASGKLSSEGTTTFGGDYFILTEDSSRLNYMATKELVEESTGLLDNEVLVEILSHPAILGESMIVNHVGTIDAQPGGDAQYWHSDGDYVPNDDVERNGFRGVGGHDLAPFAINMFTPLLPREGMGPQHGPTEFCLGTSHLKGHDMEEDLPVQDPSLLTAHEGIVERLQEFEWHIERGMDPPPHAECPEYLHRIPLLQEGDAILFDYMLTHRGGANRSKDTNRSMIFATYSRKWFRDTNFDTEFGRRFSVSPLQELTRLTRFALVVEDETNV